MSTVWTLTQVLYTISSSRLIYLYIHALNIASHIHTITGFTAITEVEPVPHRTTWTSLMPTVWNTFLSTIHHTMPQLVYWHINVLIHSQTNLWFTAITEVEPVPHRTTWTSPMPTIWNNTQYIALYHDKILLTKPLFHRYYRGYTFPPRMTWTRSNC